MRKLLTVPLLLMGGVASAADNVASDYWVRVMPAAWFVGFDGDAKYTENGVAGDSLSLDDVQVPLAQRASDFVALDEALEKLSGFDERKCKIVEMRFFGGLMDQEIAEVLDCPLGTVKSRIFHGLAALRRILDSEGEEARQMPAFPSEDISHAV